MSYKFSPYLRAIVITTGIISASVGIIVILGWLFNVPFLKSLNPDYISMKPNTALSFIFIGISIIILHNIKHSIILRNFARTLLIIVLFISAITLSEYIFKWNAGIDELLFLEGPGTTATIYPGRMAVNTVICFILLSISLLITDTRFKWCDIISQLLAITTGLISVLPQLGYAYNEADLFTFAYRTPMALHTAVTLLTISIGIFFLRPAAGILKVLGTDGLGGFLARRLFPVIIIIPIVFIWFRLAIKAGGYNLKSIDLELISLLYIILFVATLWKIIGSLNSLDLKRRESETQLLIAKEEAEQNKNKLEAIFNSVSDGVAVADMNGTFFLVNPAQARINGFATIDEMEKNLSYFIEVYELSFPDGQSVPVDQWPISMVLRGESVSDYILNGRRRDTGQEWVFSFNGEPVLDEYGKQILAVIITRDITAHKRIADNEILAHEILDQLNKNEESEIMINKVIQAIKNKTGFEAVAIRLQEGEDFPYYKTTGFSEEFVEAERYLCCYDKEGKIIRNTKGDPLLDCMCGNILCGRVDSTKSFFTEGGSFRSNNTTQLLATTSPEDRLARTRNRCNSAGYESVALIPIKSGNNIIGLLQLNDHRKNIFNEEIIPFFEGLGTNIGIALMRNKAENELRQLNEELEHRVNERTQQLNDSNKELESFAYSVSHDLRAPLRHIIGFSEKLGSALKDSGNSEVDRITGIIKKSASKMSLLIDELLAYSRFGRTNLIMDMVSLQKVVSEVIKEAQDIIQNRNIEWKIGTLPDVNADKTLMHLVLQNLINNAIKFTAKKEKTIIEILCDETDKKDYKFFIKDNGAGFNMEYVNKLFGVFQRLHTSEEFEGTGIGLATVRRIIKRHGGTVWAEGKENEGATFCFTLPKGKVGKTNVKK